MKFDLETILESTDIMYATTHDSFNGVKMPKFYIENSDVIVSIYFSDEKALDDTINILKQLKEKYVWEKI